MFCVCTVLLFYTVMSQDMMGSVMPDRNQSTIDFPKIPADFREMAKKLVT